MTAVIVPYDQLESETLNNVIEEFVSRDGTDYGEFEVSLEIKISRILSQLKSKKVVIIFDHDTETCTILSSDDPALDSI